MVKQDAREARLLEEFREDLERRLRAPWRWELLTPPSRTARFDAVLRIHDPEGRTHQFAVEAKTTLFPANVGPTLERLRQAYPSGPWLLIAPFIGARARELAREAGVSWLEPGGDCSIARGAMFIEHLGAQQRPRDPESGRRVADLFSGKALRIVRWLLVEPETAWTLAEMSQAAHVSMPFVSRTFATLEDEVYASRQRGATRLTQPEALLEAWATAAAPEVRVHQRVFLPGPAAFLRRLAERPPTTHYALTAEAAADQLAPYARFPRVELYVDDLASWEQDGELEPVPRGGNVYLLESPEEGVFDAAESVRNLSLVCRVQLYVDLFRRGGAAREAADFLRKRGALWAKATRVTTPEP
jgi:hypothetical protein